MRLMFLMFFLLFTTQLFCENDFLLINNSSERSAKGDAGVSEYSDISYAIINPASTIKNKNPQISFTYLLYNNNLNYNYLGVGFPIFSGLFSIHVIYLSLPNLEGSIGGEGTGDYMNYNDMSMIVSESFRLWDFMNMGISFKYIKREISEYKAETFGVDLGVIKDIELFNMDRKKYNNFSIGGSLRNVGGKMEFIEEKEDLPLSITSGIKYKPFFKWSLLFDVNKVKNRGLNSYFGLEYLSPFYLEPRVGIKFEEETVIMTGLGLNVQAGYLKFKIDYSHNLFGQQVKSHSISLNLEIQTVRNIVQKVYKTNIVVKKTNISLSSFKKRGTQRIIVLDYINTSMSDDLEYLAETIPESISTYFAKKENITVINKKAVKNRLEMLEVRLTDFNDDKEMKLLGKLFNADKLITGSYVEINNRIRINTRVIDITTGDIIIAEQTQSDADKEIFLLLDNTAIQLYDKLKKR